MSGPRRCEQCAHAREAVLVPASSGRDSCVRVRCGAPLPAFADALDDDREIGHKAATYCEAFAPRAVSLEVAA